MKVFFLLPLIHLHITEGCSNLEENGDLIPVTAYTGDSVLLPCFCGDLHTKPQNFTWSKYVSLGKWKIIFFNHEQYNDRYQLVIDQSSRHFSLLISNLTVEDGGDYICNLTDSKNRYIRLTVTGSRTESSTSTPVITTSSPTSTAGQRRRQIENGDDEQTGMRVQQKEQDDVTYMTVVHSDPVRAEQTPVASEDTAVYSLVQTY
ncbi:hypothetical protein C0J50_23266 [Silurus asotus]|uniref:Ig-like domain-containing protein n=1 Tax=Silurus asotus TaxID=30991 RepID=A0AAD5AI55_SILAS|nr:hypothetical protein C0J50_23266 [Silurus asotus]